MASLCQFSDFIGDIAVNSHTPDDSSLLRFFQSAAEPSDSFCEEDSN
jgi:hypothetical protein